MLKLDAKEAVKRILVYVMTMVLVVSMLPVMSVQVKADEFEASISAFPESYKVYLRELHVKYPQWVFKAYDTGLDFSTAVANEASNNKSLVQNLYNEYLKSKAPGDYNPSTGTYIAKDGNSWVSASRNTVAYFMDPRNFLNESHITMFEQLSYDSVAHTQAGVEAILGGSFMYNTNIGYLDAAGNHIITTELYSAKIMEAAQTAKVSPYYLASKILQEVGKSTGSYPGMGGGSSVNGKYSGYPGIYNFYNIGASDGTNAVANGLKWASTGNTYRRPWDTPAKSIVGGATYIGEKYINAGQDTTYFQRFNVVKESSYDTYTHQYMTSIYGCASESATTMTAYNSLGITASAKTFVIPVYQNMPEETTTITLGSGAKTGIVTSNVNMRIGPSTSYEKVMTLMTNEVVTVVEGVMTDIPYSTKWLNNPYWYKLSVVRDGVTYEGYVSANYINVKSEITIISGVPEQLTTTLSRTETVYYEVDNPSIATVNEQGIVTGIGEGTTTVRAYTQSGKFSVCGVTVLALGAVLDRETVTINRGESLQLGVTVYPLDSADKTVIWSSSDANVVSVAADGTITGVAYGEAIITAKANVGGVEGKCKVIVRKPVESIKLNKKKATVAVGNQIKLKRTITPSDATDKTVTWTSSDESIATVNAGVVTGISPGNAKITVTTTDGNKTATCTVKVRPQKITTFSATNRTYNSVKLTWTDIPNVAGYRIYRKNSKGKYKWIKSVPAGTTSLVDRKFTAGTTQSYKIAAYAVINGTNRVGVKSDIVNVKVIPGKVVIKSANKVGKAAIRLKWKKVRGANGYAVYRKSADTGKFKRIKTIKKGSTLKFKNKKLVVGTTYYYKIRAYRTVNGKKVFGKYSDIVTVTR